MLPFRQILVYFVGSRALFLIFALLAALVVPLREGYLGSQIAPAGTPYLAWIWANFDGRHFINVATLGYQKFDFAFFPLYPILISTLGYIMPHVWAGITISLASLLGGMLVVYKIAKLDFGDKVAYNAIFFLSIFPLAFFYQAVYPDSLFLLLSTSSFYFARKGNWAWSGIFCGLVAATRLSGIAILPALAVEWYLQNRERPVHLNKLVTVVSLGITGLLGYALYLWRFFGDPLKFQKAMSAWSQSDWVFPPQVIFRYLKIFFLVEKSLLVYWIAVLEFVSLFAYFCLSIYVWKRVRISYGVFMIVLLTLVAFTGTFAGTPRFMLHLFPGFIGLAILSQRHKRFRYSIVMASLVLGLVLTGLFTRGYFVS